MGGKRQHNPYDWARVKGIVPQETPSFGTPGGGTASPTGNLSIPAHYFYTQSVNQQSSMVDEVDDEGASTNRLPDIYKYGGHGMPSFREGWYDPAFEAGVRAPLHSALGMEGEGRWASKVDTSVSDLITLSEAFNLPANQLPEFTQGMEESMPGFESAAMAGYAEPVLHKDLKSDVTDIGTSQAIAKDAYETEIASLDQDIVDAKKGRKESLLDQTIARKQLMTDRTSAIDESRAAQATSGMAYSAPAARQEESDKEAQMTDLSDIKREEYKIEESYESDLENIEAAKQDAETAYLGEQSGFLTDLKGAFQQSGDLLSNQLTEVGADLLGDWESWGQTLEPSQDSRGLLLGRDRYGKGYKNVGGKFFQESNLSEVAPEFELAGQLAQESERWVDFLTQAANLKQDEINTELGV